MPLCRRRIPRRRLRRCRRPGGFGGGQYNVNVEDLFGDSGGGFGDFLGGLFNRGVEGVIVSRGADRTSSELTLSFDDALDGVTVPLA